MGNAIPDCGEGMGEGPLPIAVMYAGAGWRAMETDLVTRTWGMLCVGKREMSVCEVLCWS